jgi:hypothetical protein
VMVSNQGIGTSWARRSERKYQMPPKDACVYSTVHTDASPTWVIFHLTGPMYSIGKSTDRHAGRHFGRTSYRSDDSWIHADLRDRVGHE